MGREGLRVKGYLALRPRLFHCFILAQPLVHTAGNIKGRPKWTTEAMKAIEAIEAIEAIVVVSVQHGSGGLVLLGYMGSTSRLSL